MGDVVILQESGTIPANWPLARVVDIHPGQDKLVRVVTVKTSQGTYRRPVRLLSWFPMSELELTLDYVRCSD